MHVSVRDDVLRQAGYGSIAEGLNDLKLDSVELEFFRDYTVWDTAGWNKISFAPKDAVEKIKDSYGEKKIKICAFLLHNNFNCPEPQKEVQWVIDVIKTAEGLQIPAIRIDAITKGEKEEPFEVRVTRFVDCMRQALAATSASEAPRGKPRGIFAEPCEAKNAIPPCGKPQGFAYSAVVKPLATKAGLAKKCKVALGIENHGVQGNDPAFLKQVIERVGNERLGVNMDTGNFYWYGFPLNEVYDVLRSVAPHTKHTHVKNIRYPEEMRQQKRASGWEYGKYVSPIYEGDIDHKQVVAILKSAGYNGPLTIEDECLGKFEESQKKEVLRKDTAYLKGLLG